MANNETEKLMQEAVDEPLPGTFELFKKHGLLVQNIMGDIGPAFVDEKTIRYLSENYVTKPNEVFIVTYVKTGTTWVQKICIEIIKTQKKCEIKKFFDVNRRHIVWMETYLAQAGHSKFNDYINQFKHTLCFWKTHANYHAFSAKSINPLTKLIVVCKIQKMQLYLDIIF